MPRPMSTLTGKITDLRSELDYLRGHPEIVTDEDPKVTAYSATIQKVKGIYAAEGSIKKTAARLGVGKRTLERAMNVHAELARAIDDVRAHSV